MWDVFTRIFTGVLLAALIGVYAQLQNATIELAKANVTLVAMGERVADHEMRIRVLELPRRANGLSP
jgi:hypothetical protein